MGQQSGQNVRADGSIAPALTPEGIGQATRSFAEAGYVVLRDVVPKDKLAALHTDLMTEFDSQSRAGRLFSGGGLISGHLNCFPGEQSRFAYDAIKAHGVIDLVKALQPGVENDMRVGCNFNLPGSVAQHYHADGVFTEGFLVVNVAVVDTEIANGAIDVLPGTHKKFYKFWRYAAERAYKRTTRLPMKQGDVLVRSSNLWHRGMPNLTNAPRPMIALTFGEKGGSLPDPYSKDNGKITFHPNWYTPSLLGRIRERTFVKVPLSYSAYRLARSLIGNKGY